MSSFDTISYYKSKLKKNFKKAVKNVKSFPIKKKNHLSGFSSKSIKLGKKVIKNFSFVRRIVII
jgi:hypothetical protein